MVKCTHLIEEKIYVVSGKSIENKRIFKRSTEKREIRRKIKAYLQHICSILHIEIHHNEFHVVLKMKARDEFEKFFKNKHNGKVKEAFFIPASTYIFGRQMSNLQVSFVKSYNWKFKRKGVLMDGRYRRNLIQTEEELDRVIQALKSGRYRISEKKDKTNVEKSLSWKKPKEGQTKRENGGESLIIRCIEGSEIDLRGCFESPFKTSLVPPFLYHKIKIFRSNYPCGPNYN